MGKSHANEKLHDDGADHQTPIDISPILAQGNGNQNKNGNAQYAL
jgi:hypothetical protein